MAKSDELRPEVYEPATEAMNALFKVYLHSKDDVLCAHVREMMEAFWQWRDRHTGRPGHSSAPPDSFGGGSQF